MEDCYKILGTSKDYIDTKRAIDPSEEKIDSFIKEKYEIAKKNLLNLGALPEKKERLEQQLKQINDAYRKIRNKFSREIYDRELETRERKEPKVVQTKRKTPFDKLSINEQDLDVLTEEEQDKFIKKQKEKLSKEYEHQLEELSDSRFTDKMKLTRKLNEVREAYEEIKNEERRKLIKEQIQKERQEEEKRQREQEIKETYSHISEYDLSLIDRTKKFEQLMVMRKEVDSQETSYRNNQNQEIKVKKIAKIFYCTTLGLKSFVNEFQIKRMTPEGEKIDVVKTGLDIDDLRFVEPEGRDCIINKLLSDELILASKYNAGYIGEIEKIKNETEKLNNTKSKNYDVTLKRKKLTPNEKEMLTAIMIIEERNKGQKEEEREGVAK